MDRRYFTKLIGTVAMSSMAAPALVLPARAMSAEMFKPKATRRGTYLIKNGAIITVDPSHGTLPRADIVVRNGIIEQIGENLSAPDAEVIDAKDMIVMPGFIDAHYHMWSSLGRSFTAADGYAYYPAKWATAPLYTPDDFYVSTMLGHMELINAGSTTVHNWDHNTRSPAHADAELLAHQHSLMRARYAYGHVDRMAPDQVNRFADIPRVKTQWFSSSSPFEGLVHLGTNLRGPLQSDLQVFYKEMDIVQALGLPACIHAAQEAPNLDDAVEYERRGILGPNFLIAHYLPGRSEDFEAMARTNTPIAISTQSELHLTSTGDPRAAIFRMRRAGLKPALSTDATSIAPPNMFEMMRLTWDLAVPWKDTQSQGDPPVSISEVIRMATINGAVALGIADVTGSITVGKRADIIMIRTNDINVAPVENVETTVVAAASPANVDTVMIDGRIVKRHGKLTAHDVEHIVAAAKVSADRIRNQLGPKLKYTSAVDAQRDCCGYRV